MQMYSWENENIKISYSPLFHNFLSFPLIINKTEKLKRSCMRHVAKKFSKSRRTSDQKFTKRIVENSQKVDFMTLVRTGFKKYMI